MRRLEWKKQANNDLIKIVVHIAEDNEQAAEQLADLILGKVEQLRDRPELYRTGRQRDTRETVDILRIKHTAQRWPPKGKA